MRVASLKDKAGAQKGQAMRACTWGDVKHSQQRGSEDVPTPVATVREGVEESRGVETPMVVIGSLGDWADLLVA